MLGAALAAVVGMLAMNGLRTRIIRYSTCRVSYWRPTIGSFCRSRPETLGFDLEAARQMLMEFRPREISVVNH